VFAIGKYVEQNVYQVQKRLEVNMSEDEDYLMEFKRPRKKIFMRGEDDRINIPVAVAAMPFLEELAADGKVTVNLLIADMIEDYLVWLAEQGEIKWPNGYDRETGKFIKPTS
jgi:DNA-binding ferritin-like protein (Dps family)